MHDAGHRLSPLALAGLLVWAHPACGQIAGGVHVVTAANRQCTGGRCTFLDDTPWYPDHCDAMVLSSANWNPPGSAGIYFAAPVLTTSFSDTHCYRSLLGPPGQMPLGAAFNVLTVHDNPECLHEHVAYASNSGFDFTFIDWPGVLDDDPTAFLLVQPEFGFQSFAPLAVYYEGDIGRWDIVTEDHSAMPLGADFLVYATTSGCNLGLSGQVQHTCTGPSGNTCSLGTVAQGDPNARLLVTQVMSGTAVYNPHPIGVYYAGLWRVFNEDLAPMPEGAIFNVAVIQVLLQEGFESGDRSGWSASAP